MCTGSLAVSLLAINYFMYGRLDLKEVCRYSSIELVRPLNLRERESSIVTKKAKRRNLPRPQLSYRGTQREPRSQASIIHLLGRRRGIGLPITESRDKNYHHHHYVFAKIMFLPRVPGLEHTVHNLNVIVNIAL